MIWIIPEFFVLHHTNLLKFQYVGKENHKMVKRNKLHCVLRTVVFTIFDLLFSFVGICFHGTSPSFQHFRDDFAMPYKFNNSVCDLFMISSLRMLFLFVGCFILLFNKNRVCWLKLVVNKLVLINLNKNYMNSYLFFQPSRALGHLAHASFALCILLISFTPAKFLGLRFCKKILKTCSK